MSGRFFDQYRLRSHYVAALLLAAPVVLIATLAIRAIGLSLLLACMPPLSLAMGVALVMADRIRDQGKSLEPKFWSTRGGFPTGRILLKKTSWISDAQRKRYIKNLRKLVPGTLEDGQDLDAMDPHSQREVVEGMVSWLRSSTRGHKMVETANADYGRARSLFALRPVGLLLSSISVVVSLCSLAYSVLEETQTIEISAVIGGGAAVVLALWLFQSGARALEQAGERYAERLLEATDNLVSSILSR